MSAFRQSPAPRNFRYASNFDPLTALPPSTTALRLDGDDGPITFELLGDGVIAIRHRAGRGRTENPSQAVLSVQPTPNQAACVQTPDSVELRAGNLALKVDPTTGSWSLTQGSSAGAVLTAPSQPFGMSGTRRIALLDYVPGEPIHGLGEKCGPLNQAGRTGQFWNVDVIADHSNAVDADFDPTYVSIPFVLMRRHGQWVGVLLHNPGRTWIHAGLVHQAGHCFHPGLGLRSADEPVVALVTEDGPLDLFVLSGPTMADVVRRLARLTGVHAMPPRWALGYHQCRWGYRSIEEFERVAARLQEGRYPTQALWLDIDYMNEFRVFTWSERAYANPKREEVLRRIRESGTHLVTIVDPGVKAEPGFDVYDEGAHGDLFCHTPEGQPYTGLVWPGASFFPDFSLQETRDWWANRVASWLSDNGLSGIWNDMNDPSTGPIDSVDMLFQRGTAPHGDYHNQYADLMAVATWEGFRRANANKRPFILTRSASTGIQRQAAVWTGDNFSNEAHLKAAIPTTLNLALSGVSFNGPDAGGFAGDTTEPLMTTWFLAGCLFPFFRNHSGSSTRMQEPYMFSTEAENILRSCINLRLKLMPYLYGVFADHEATGDPVVRPLGYEFDDPDLESVDDQFMLGASLMIAPFMDIKSSRRAVVLPAGAWCELGSGEWHAGGTTITIRRRPEPVVFVRDGSVIPCLRAADHFPQPIYSGPGAAVDLHVFMRHAETAVGRLVEDDGETFAYRTGERTVRRLTVLRNADGAHVEWAVEQDGFADAVRDVAVLFHGIAPASPSGGKRPCQFPFWENEVPFLELGA